MEFLKISSPLPSKTLIGNWQGKCTCHSSGVPFVLLTRNRSRLNSPFLFKFQHLSNVLIFVLAFSGQNLMMTMQSLCWIKGEIYLTMMNLMSLLESHLISTESTKARSE